jgi:hypothetical protein
MQESPQPHMKRASKTGTNEHVIVQHRDLRLFHALSILRIVDRKQTQIISGFNSTTRVNSRLLKLLHVGLLKRFFFVSALGGKRAIYSLSKRGAELIGTTPNGIQRPADSFLIGDKFVAHQLAINEVFCAAHFHTYIKDKTVKNWKALTKPLSPAISVIPDAYFEIHLNEIIRPMFLEVDQGTEGLTVWSKKINEYLTLASSGDFERLFAHPRFGVLVVAASERRMQSLRTHVAKITPKLFYFTTQERIAAQGFWSAIWFRPEGEQLESLI